MPEIDLSTLLTNLRSTLGALDAAEHEADAILFRTDSGKQRDAMSDVAAELADATASVRRAWNTATVETILQRPSAAPPPRQNGRRHNISFGPPPRPLPGLGGRVRKRPDFNGK